MKHKKKKNVGILFELLTRQVVQGTLTNNKTVSQNASNLINKYFSREKPLYEELSLFNTLLYNQTDSHRIADKLLNTTMVYAKQLDEDTLEAAKIRLSEDINHLFSKQDFYKTKLSNYKVYASIQQLLDNARHKQEISEITEKIVLEEVILDHLINNTEYERVNLYKKTYERLPIDNLTNCMIQSKFNEKYDETLQGSQKQLLRTFILSDEEKYHTLVEKEKEKINTIISEALEMPLDSVLKVRLQDAQEQLDKSTLSELSEDSLASLMIYADLAHDLKEEIEHASEK